VIPCRLPTLSGAASLSGALSALDCSELARRLACRVLFSRPALCALAGFGLAGFTLLALILKYPFSEFGLRYTAVTGTRFEGYHRIGSWAPWLYLFITLATSLIVQVAVVLFTAYLVNIALGIHLPLALTGGAICMAAALMLWLGRYRLLDASMKVAMGLLAVSARVAAVATLPSADFTALDALPRFDPNVVELGFLLALMGWMPTAIVFAQAANGLLLPVVAVFMLVVMNRGDILGAYRNRWLGNIIGVAIILFVTALAFTQRSRTTGIVG